MNNVSVSRVAEFLKGIGWKDTGDAQWAQLEAALPELQQLLAQPSEQPADQASYDICSHGVVGGCLRDDPEQPAKAEQPGDVGREDQCGQCLGQGYVLDGTKRSVRHHACNECNGTGLSPSKRAEIADEAALSPGVPVAYYLRSRMPKLWQSIVYPIELKLTAEAKAEDSRFEGPFPLYLAPPANDGGWQHIANEWADVATNGLQWLRNVEDGTSTLTEAKAAMQRDIDDVRAMKRWNAFFASQQEEKG